MKRFYHFVFISIDHLIYNKKVTKPSTNIYISIIHIGNSKVTVINGRASFAGPDRVEVNGTVYA